jgi:hypothetical protein
VADPLEATSFKEGIPVPVNATVWGVSPALSVTLRVALREPVATGLNVMLIVHLDAAATLVPQVLVSVNSLLCGPVILMLLMLSAAVPVLLKVTDRGTLVEPTAMFPNAARLGAKLAAAPLDLLNRSELPAAMSRPPSRLKSAIARLIPSAISLADENGYVGGRRSVRHCQIRLSISIEVAHRQRENLSQNGVGRDSEGSTASIAKQHRDDV